MTTTVVVCVHENVQVSTLPSGLVHQVQSGVSHKLVQTLLVIVLDHTRKTRQLFNSGVGGIIGIRYLL